MTKPLLAMLLLLPLSVSAGELDGKGIICQRGELLGSSGNDGYVIKGVFGIVPGDFPQHASAADHIAPYAVHDLVRAPPLAIVDNKSAEVTFNASARVSGDWSKPLAGFWRFTHSRDGSFAWHSAHQDADIAGSEAERVRIFLNAEVDVWVL